MKGFSLHIASIALGTALAGFATWADAQSYASVTPPAQPGFEAVAPAPLQDMDRVDVITLAPEAYVKGPTVRVGDVAKVEGQNAQELSSVELGPAALPGMSKDLTAAFVESRIERAGVQAQAVKVAGARAVRATTLHLEVSSGAIEQDLRQYIETNMPWDAANATIDVTVPSFNVVVPEGAVELRWRPYPRYQYLGQGAFQGQICVDGNVERTVTCRANIQAFGDVVVAARDIQRARPVSAADVVVEARDLSSLNGGFVSDPAEVIGQVARTTIFPGTVITSRHVSPPILVKRNQNVQVETTAGTLVARTQARAMADGRAGDVIPLSNGNTKEEFYGRVREDGLVVVD